MKRIHRTGPFALALICVGIFCTAPLAAPLAAQDSTPSLGDLARQVREHKQNLAATANPTDAVGGETAPLAPSATPMTEATQFTFTLTQRQGGTESTTDGFVDGAKFRLEPQDSKTADNPQGTYALSTDNGRTTYLINPAKKEFARVDTQALMTKVLDKANALYKQMGLEIESPKVETVTTEPGETLDGHPTVHHKLRITYSMHFTKNNVVVPYTEYQDLWMASDMARDGAEASDVLIYFRPTGDPRVDAAWERELAQIPGFPLRQVTLRTEVNEDGNSAVVRISRDISDVHIGPVADSLFALPANYKEVQPKENDYQYARQ